MKQRQKVLKARPVTWAADMHGPGLSMQTAQTHRKDEKVPDDFVAADSRKARVVWIRFCPPLTYSTMVQ